MAKEKSVTKIDDFKSTLELTSNPGFQSSISVKCKVDEIVYDPFEHRNVLHPNTAWGSVLHMLKAFLGTGFLAMPSAFSNGGLVAGSIGILFIGFMTSHAVHILVRTAEEICVEVKRPSLSFAETCGAAFTNGPKKFKSWGPSVKEFVDYSLMITYICVLCVYVIFISSSIKAVTDGFEIGPDLSIQTYCALTLIPLALICQVKSLKYIIPFSVVANVCMVVVIIITLCYVFTDLPPLSERKMVADVSSWPLFFSTSIFAMEGIGVVMPIANEMARPEKFLGRSGVLTISMIIVVCLFEFLGFFGYVKYGDAIKGSITLNLPEKDYVAQSTKLLMAFTILLTFALQFYVPMEIINRKLKHWKTGNFSNVIQICIRIAIVCFAVGIAAAFPNLELVIGFFGALFFSVFGVIFPIIVETLYRWDRDLGRFNYILWKNALIGVVTSVGLISGIYVSADGIIQEFITSHGVALESNSTIIL